MGGENSKSSKENDESVVHVLGQITDSDTVENLHQEHRDRALAEQFAIEERQAYLMEQAQAAQAKYKFQVAALATPVYEQSPETLARIQQVQNVSYCNHCM